MYGTPSCAQQAPSGRTPTKDGTRTGSRAVPYRHRSSPALTPPESLLSTPHHATPCHATPCHATPRHANPSASRPDTGLTPIPGPVWPSPRAATGGHHRVAPRRAGDNRLRRRWRRSDHGRRWGCGVGGRVAVGGPLVVSLTTPGSRRGSGAQDWRAGRGGCPRSGSRGPAAVSALEGTTRKRPPRNDEEDIAD